MSKKLALVSLLIFFFLSSVIALHAKAKMHFRDHDYDDEDFGFRFKPVVKRDERKIFVDNEFGKISAVYIGDGIRGPYRIHFFTLEPNSLLLPSLLHADMVLFVHTGSGDLSWVNEDETKTVKLKRGDIFRLQTGSVFFVQSDLQPERQSLRIYALFSNTDNDLFNPEIGDYSSIRNLLRGFDKTTLKQAFKVSDEVIESITSATDTEAIVHAISTKKDKEKRKKKKKSSWEIEERLLKAYLRGREENASNKKKKTKGKGYNLFDHDPDFENCNGWSLTVNPRKAEHVMGETNIGLFMVNLTKGSMMGPHWNPRATEIAIVLQGQGMIRVVCSSSGGNESRLATVSGCRNRRFLVKEGDAFAVPRFHPMAQMSFNNDSFVFMGFSTTRQENRPQFLAGRQSVLQVLDADVLALSFNVPNATVSQLLAPQAESVILECISCAEEEERKMVEETEAREREKEEATKREEEEKERKRREEEEREREKQKEEEEKERQRQEEDRERQRQEQEEKERQKQEEEERERKRQEQEEKERERQEEEEIEREKHKQEEEEEERERQEQEEKERERQRQEEEERERQQQQEEQQRKEQEEEERQRQQEDEEKERQKEEEEGGDEGRVFLKMRTG